MLPMAPVELWHKLLALLNLRSTALPTDVVRMVALSVPEATHTDTLQTTRSTAAPWPEAAWASRWSKLNPITAFHVNRCLWTCVRVDEL